MISDTSSTLTSPAPTVKRRIDGRGIQRASDAAVTRRGLTLVRRGNLFPVRRRTANNFFSKWDIFGQVLDIASGSVAATQSNRK